MPTQFQHYKDGAWHNVATVQLNDAVAALIRTALQPVRLLDAATDQILAQSISAPRRVKNRGGQRHHVTFNPVREPDPYTDVPVRSMRTRFPGRYQPFSDI